MAKNKKTLRFWLRTDRKNQDGTAPLHLIYQISGVRKYYAIPETKMYSVNWNPKEQSAVCLTKQMAKKLEPNFKFEDELLLTATEARDINNRIAVLREDVKKIQQRFELDNVPYSAENITEALREMKSTTKKERTGDYIADFIKQFVKDSTGSHKVRTLQVYNGLATHITAYEKTCGKRATFEKLDIPFLRGFVGYLSEPKVITLVSGKKRNVKGMNNITIAKQISTLKTLLKYARTQYKIDVNATYQDFKVARKDSNFEVVTLTNDEFLKLYNIDLSENKRLDRVRDVFCFACATGLRYSDLQQLKREHIRHNTIKMTASKTGQRLEIPLNPFSFAILAKYKGLHKPLPVISGQKTNQFLKELGKKAEINTPIEKVREYGVRKKSITYEKWQLLSIHVGRKTFTTLSLEKGIAPQEVMALTGHTTYKAFKRYVDVTNDRKKLVMAKAWGEVKETNLKAV
ncbi:site-specific integrase [Agriterribacter sp.]|uniref:site-specific integrase n=1 Tax=Agriterribacter sp. TaxID=2821509 RepID=UPI002CDE7A9E|nr:tyrosine-type recombinase/integrase [Agriterribacter sp.]HTN08848.1 tyrosine-type recombinase/integrase [Agriterribacter sp.]